MSVAYTGFTGLRRVDRRWVGRVRGVAASRKKAPEGACHGPARSDALAVLAGAGVDLDLVTLSHKNWHADFEAGGDLGRLEYLAGRVALDGGFGPGDFAHHAGGQLDRDGLAIVEHDFHCHAVLEVVERVAHILEDGMEVEV